MDLNLFPCIFWSFLKFLTNEILFFAKNGYRILEQMEILNKFISRLYSRLKLSLNDR